MFPTTNVLFSSPAAGFNHSTVISCQQLTFLRKLYNIKYKFPAILRPIKEPISEYPCICKILYINCHVKLLLFIIIIKRVVGTTSMIQLWQTMTLADIQSWVLCYHSWTDLHGIEKIKTSFQSSSCTKPKPQFNKLYGTKSCPQQCVSN